MLYIQRKSSRDPRHGWLTCSSPERLEKQFPSPGNSNLSLTMDGPWWPLYTPKVNIAALKMDGWKIKSPFGMAYFQKPSLVVLHNTEVPIMSSFSGIVRFWFSCPITRMLLMSSYHEPGSWGLKARSVAIIVHKLFGTSYKLLTKQNLMLSFKCVFLQKKSFQDLFDFLQKKH